MGLNPKKPNAPKESETPSEKKPEWLSGRQKIAAYLALAFGLFCGLLGVSSLVVTPGIAATVVAGHATVSSVSGCSANIALDWRPPEPLVTSLLPLCNLQTGQSLVVTLEVLPGGNQTVMATVATNGKTYFLPSSADALFVSGEVFIPIAIVLIALSGATLFFHKSTPLMRTRGAVLLFLGMILCMMVGLSFGFDLSSGAHPMAALLAMAATAAAFWGALLLWRRRAGPIH